MISYLLVFYFSFGELSIRMLCSFSYWGLAHWFIRSSIKDFLSTGYVLGATETMVRGP